MLHRLNDNTTQNATFQISRFISKINHFGNVYNFPFVILLSIMAYEIMKINLQIIFRESHGHTSLFDNSWALSSVLGSTLLGFFSDRFSLFSWRKPICLIGIFCSLVTGIAFLHPALHDSENKFSILFFVLLNGLSGSYLGAARAFYLDQFRANKVLHFSITVIFQCIPWIVTGGLLAEQFISLNFLRIFSVILVAIAFFANVFFAYDKRKSQFESRHGGNEFKELSRKYNHIRYWSIILSFFILAISYHLMPYLGEYAFFNSTFYQEVFFLGLGVSAGVPIAFLFLKTSTLKALKFGYIICFLYFLLIGFFYWSGTINSEKTLKYQFLIFAILGGSLWILSLKEFLIKSKFTEDGLVLGLIESIQSLGEFVGAGLSSFLASSIISKKQINIKFFLFLLFFAFVVVSMESIFRLFKIKHKN